jgi:DNA-directed RNA polymerase subunit RPC12/RpoP
VTERKRISLKVIAAPSSGHVLDAPPPLAASTHTVDYTCGHCGVVLMYAEEEQVHGVLIRCTECGSHNVTG